MKRVHLIFAIAALAIFVGLIVWAALRPQAAPDEQADGLTHHQREATGALRIALVPERDIFEQRARYEALAAYLVERLDQPIDLVTLNTYDRVLRELAERRIDGAFVGSMVAVLAYDRLDARLVVKPVLPGGIDSYHGVMITPHDSPIHSIEDLAGGQIAGVRATTAGDLFPVYLLHDRGLVGRGDRVDIRWVGTHDDVIHEVVEGRCDAGAVKNLRLDDWLAKHPEVRLRAIARSEPVPNNALIMRRDIDAALIDRLSALLRSMHESELGRSALARFGAERFVSCTIEQYEAFYRMSAALGEAWSLLGVEGPAPRPLDATPAPEATP